MGKRWSCPPTTPILRKSLFSCSPPNLSPRTSFFLKRILPFLHILPNLPTAYLHRPRFPGPCYMSIRATCPAVFFSSFFLKSASLRISHFLHFLSRGGGRTQLRFLSTPFPPISGKRAFFDNDFELLRFDKRKEARNRNENQSKYGIDSPSLSLSLTHGRATYECMCGSCAPMRRDSSSLHRLSLSNTAKRTRRERRTSHVLPTISHSGTKLGSRES